MDRFSIRTVVVDQGRNRTGSVQPGWWLHFVAVLMLLLSGCSDSHVPPDIESFLLADNTGFYDDAQSANLETTGVVKLRGRPVALSVELDTNGDEQPEAIVESDPKEGRFRFPDPEGIPVGDVVLRARAVRKAAGSSPQTPGAKSGWVLLRVRKVPIDWGHLSASTSEIGPPNLQFSVGLPNGVPGRILVDINNDGMWDHTERYDPEYQGAVIEQLDKADLLGNPRHSGTRTGKVRIEADGLPPEEREFEILIYDVPPDVVVRWTPTKSPNVLKLSVITTSIGLDQVSEIRIEWSDGKKSVIMGDKCEVEHDFGQDARYLLFPGYISVVDEDGEHHDEYDSWTVIDERKQ